ncbi:MAG: hypothetical protein C0631_11560 [Sedimenticola sp.]|nr:MAG: hypothetical protein C0631_11560 [Sedimenticola sp.]
MDKTQTQNTTDRRRYFRIEDSVNLSYQVIRAEELPERLARLESELDSDFTVMSSLAAVSQQMSGILHKIEASQPDIASYLKALDKKVDILGRALLIQNSDISEHATNQVNLSASGVAFQAAEALVEGTLLELRLLLFPSFTGIMTFAEVIGCQPLAQRENDFSHSIRVNFTHLRESDRDVIIGHVIRKQGDLLRQQREEREGS